MNFIYHFVLVLLISALLNAEPQTKQINNNLIVQTSNGQVQGKTITVTQKYDAKYQVNAWLGIPYADKPIDDLRFKPPQPAKNWNGVLNTTTWPNTCYQAINVFNDAINTPLSEDCLYLNVFAPNPMPTNAPVMFWIYGGGFIGGSSSLYDPSMIVAETNVIVVSIQYRVSIFGFLYLNDTEAPGNQGLLDQQMALQWVQNNIKNFGGDKTKVTIFGESAGAASVSLHLLSPLSRDLFRNAIMESASVLAPWSLLDNTVSFNEFNAFLQSIGCSGNVKDQITCARKIDASTLLANATPLASSMPANLITVPVVDGNFLLDSPTNLLKSGNFKKCAVLAGANKNEGNYMLLAYNVPEYITNSPTPPNITYDRFTSIIKSVNPYYPKYPTLASDVVQKSIVYRYTNWNDVDNANANLDNLDAAVGDLIFRCPTIDFAKAYAQFNQDVYMFHFEETDSQYPVPQWFGSTHGSELNFVFGKPLYDNSNYTYQDRVLTRKVLRYWSNFAKYNDPNKPSDSSCWTCAILQFFAQLFNLEQGDWPKYQIVSSPYSDEQRAYLALRSDSGPKVGYNLRAEYCEFWSSYLSSLQ